MVDPYISALERALPGEYLGKRWAVIDRHSYTPDTPVAVFQYEGDAYDYARRKFGRFYAFTFIMRDGVEVVPVGAPAVIDAVLLSVVAPRCFSCSEAATRYLGSPYNGAPAQQYACDTHAVAEGRWTDLPAAAAIRIAKKETA